MDWTSTEVASSSPLRSVISPRCAGNVLVLRELVEGHLRQGRLLHDLPPHEPGADQRRQQRDDDEKDQGAGTTVGPGEHVGLRAAAVCSAAVLGQSAGWAAGEA